MLNIHLTPEIPESDEFDHETFTEICRYDSELSVNFIIKLDDDLVTQENWKTFLKGIEEDPEKKSGHLQALWSEGPARASRMDVVPKNSIPFHELLCMNPKQMYRKLVSKIGKFDQIESVGAFLDELNPYSSSVKSITIYDKFLIQFERDFTMRKGRR